MYFTCFICDKSNVNNCYSNLGNSYTAIGYQYDTNEIKGLLAGAFNFKTLEIEVLAQIN